MRKLYVFILAAFLFVACDSRTEMTEPDTVEVTLSLSGAPLAKADSPLIPDVENLIYDVWILQYDKMGLLIDKGTSHERTTSPGSLIATVATNFAVGDGNTICVLANLDRGNASVDRTWPQTLSEFKNSCNVVDLSADIDAANGGVLEDMPMFGYWEGTIDYPTNNVQVSLGRMLTRINLLINNKTASAVNVESIANISKKVYAFPDVDHEPLPDDAYGILELNQSVAAKTVKEMYFYTAPNFTEGKANATALNITGKSSVILSNGSPSDNPRDYNLYHNSNYTFTINVN